ncbi:13738_t:CDS:2 [Funneliformis mosseae]|uniref:13738_t:CDS:1 n=1 Tax=Funneliformis mosseae TaxID=27381 RepID=A0A9N9C1Q4_FUNMO|nr:13738_t:CDS:2 [Funneliformis mosseae]
MKTYTFGPHLIRASQVFFLSKKCFGFVNLKPVANGRILLLTTFVYRDLNSDEDGPEAGQTVPHCHLHIIPRKVGDWANNDDIYGEIDKSTKVDNEERPPRSFEEMEKEANFLRSFFQSDDMNYN